MVINSWPRWKQSAKVNKVRQNHLRHAAAEWARSCPAKTLSLQSFHCRLHRHYMCKPARQQLVCCCLVSSPGNTGHDGDRYCTSSGRRDSPSGSPAEHNKLYVPAAPDRSRRSPHVHSSSPLSQNISRRKTISSAKEIVNLWQ